MKREKKDYWKGINKALFSLNVLYMLLHRLQETDAGSQVFRL